jgi:hypothetical protein
MDAKVTRQQSRDALLGGLFFHAVFTKESAVIKTGYGVPIAIDTELSISNWQGNPICFLTSSLPDTNHYSSSIW